MAQTQRYELDDGAALSADGWTFIEAGATSSFSAGLLRLQSTKGYAEWMLRTTMDKPAPSVGWLAEAKPGRGWWVEARLRVGALTNCISQGPGLWIDDGKFFFQLHFDAAAVHLSTTQARDLPVAGGDFHVYRLQSLGGRHFQLLIDGAVAYDEPQLQAEENTKALMFGDLGGCDATDSTWDYVSYETFGPGTAAGDGDADGVANASDNCVLLANADQADADHDGAGDACDICPQDAKDDQDNDGLCADKDTCPTDFRNDQDRNGVCDSIQCAPYMLQGSVPVGACPTICNCVFVGNDPIGGFGHLDNFGGSNFGTGNTSMGGGGVAGGSGGRATSTATGGVNDSSGAGRASPTSSSDGGSTGSASSSDSAGCSCRLAPARGSAPLAAWFAHLALLAALGGAFQRRRARAAR